MAVANGIVTKAKELKSSVGDDLCMKAENRQKLKYTINENKIVFDRFRILGL